MTKTKRKLTDQLVAVEGAKVPISMKHFKYLAPCRTCRQNDAKRRRGSDCGEGPPARHQRAPDGEAPGA